MYKHSSIAKDLIEWGRSYDDSKLEILESMYNVLEGVCGIDNYGYEPERLKNAVNASRMVGEEIDKFFEKYNDFDALEYAFDLEKLMKLIIADTIHTKTFLDFYRENIDNYGFTSENKTSEDAKNMCVELVEIVKKHGLEKEYTKGNDFRKQRFNRIEDDLRMYNKKRER